MSENIFIDVDKADLEKIQKNVDADRYWYIDYWTPIKERMGWAETTLRGGTAMCGKIEVGLPTILIAIIVIINIIVIVITLKERQCHVQQGRGGSPRDLPSSQNHSSWSPDKCEDQAKFKYIEKERSFLVS